MTAETDLLLPVSSGNSMTRQPRYNCLTISNWALVVTLIIALIVDITLRTHQAANSDSDESSISPTTLNVVSQSTQPSTPIPNNRRYHATQFVSFTINTLGGSASHGECEGKAIDPTSDTCYLGDTDVEKDIEHRLSIFKDVLETLRNDVFKEDPEIDRDPRVLKILMLPEFFMRGALGAYSTEEMFDSDDDEEDGLLIQLSDRVHDMISDEAFENYLFILGTVIVCEKARDDLDGKLTADDLLYYNYAPVYKGGPGPVQKYVVLKQYISGADFLSRTELPNPSEYDMHAYAKADKSIILGETFAKRNVTVVTDNYLQIDGIEIGIEICLDHRMGALWSHQRIKRNDQLVDVQLIISAGMSIERGPNPIKPGGVVYLTDGEASSAACLRTDNSPYDPNHVCRDKPDGLQHLPHGGAGYSSFFALSGCIDMQTDKLLEGYYSQYQTQGCEYTLLTYGIDVMGEFDFYPPSIEVYPSVDLP
jgi:hypothetical protein